MSWGCYNVEVSCRPSESHFCISLCNINANRVSQASQRVNDGWEKNNTSTWKRNFQEARKINGTLPQAAFIYHKNVNKFIFLAPTLFGPLKIHLNFFTFADKMLLCNFWRRKKVDNDFHALRLLLKLLCYRSRSIIVESLTMLSSESFSD